jgi:AcrR family transcriptional regulator
MTAQPPAPGRPLVEEHRGDQATRTKILLAAERLFAEQGYHSTRTKQLAQAAGVSTGLVFYYFSSKQQILDELVEERSFGAYLPSLVAAAFATNPPADALLEVGTEFLAALEERRDVVRILVQGGGDTEPLQLFRDLVDRSVHVLADALASGAQRAGLDRVDSEAIARMFLSTIVIAALTGHGDTRLVGQLVDQLLGSSHVGP